MKNNKLIADFVGIQWHNNGTVSNYPSELNMAMGVDTKNDLQFHCSWNWLMYAVHRIENNNIMGYVWTHSEAKVEVEFWFSVEIRNVQCMVNRDVLPQYYGTETDFLKLYDGRNTSKFDAVYLAVVKFIQWYNRQTKLKINQLL